MSHKTEIPSPGEAKVLELVAAMGILRPRDLRAGNLSVAYLQRLVAKGRLVKLGRGQYALPDREPTGDDMLAMTAKRYPGTVVCLLTALRLHELTTQSPRAIWLAVEGSKLAPADTPTAIQVIRLSGRAFHEGIQIHQLGQVPVRIDPADRRRLFPVPPSRRPDVAIEAPKVPVNGRRHPRRSDYAESCRAGQNAVSRGA
jgi:hypothetical protein